MRIVGGELGGRRFGRPGPHTRPTSERVREALASALEARDAFADAQVLDLYAGTGALGFEALSRGAKQAVLVEGDTGAVRDIKRSAAWLGVSERVRVLRLGLEGGAAATAERLATACPGPFDLIFADPPYARSHALPPLLDALVDRGLVAAEAYVVVEHARNRPPAGTIRLASEASYRYGDTAVALMRRHTDAVDPAPGGEPRS